MTFTRTYKMKLWLKFALWQPIKEYLQRIYYCHHNAKVIADFEERMSMVIYASTNGKMSKAYYTLDSMLPIIREAFEEQYELGYSDAKEECAECSQEINAHDDLVAALENVQEKIAKAAESGFTDKDAVMAVFDSNRKTSEALAKAKAGAWCCLVLY